MAENKKSFVLYADLIKSIEHLTNEEKGILFTHLLEYVNDINPVLTDRLILTAWKPIELQLKRDLRKFEEVKSKRSDAGKRSAELRMLNKEQQTSTNLTSVDFVQQTSTNSTDNDNVNDNVNVNDIYYKELLSSESWLQTTAMQSKNKLTIKEIKEYLFEFKNHLNACLENKANKKEFASHFVRWLNTQPKKEVIKKPPLL